MKITDEKIEEIIEYDGPLTRQTVLDLVSDLKKAKLAAVTAVAPLEVIRISGQIKNFSPHLQECIYDGIRAVRNLLNMSIEDLPK